MSGKNIRSFFADGEPTGILLAEISNWTGKVLVAPRSQLDQRSKREEVRRTGVYLLIGPDPDDPSGAPAHFGEGENVLKRLLRYNKNEATESEAVHSQLDRSAVHSTVTRLVSGVPRPAHG